MDYNLSGGGEHFMRMSQVVCKHLIGEDRFTSETMRQVYLLGWALEMVNFVSNHLTIKSLIFFLFHFQNNHFEQVAMSLLMTDDILDNAQRRRNKICWYRHKDVKLLAVNDIMMVQNAGSLVLKRFFWTFTMLREYDSDN